MWIWMLAFVAFWGVVNLCKAQGKKEEMRIREDERAKVLASLVATKEVPAYQVAALKAANKELRN